MNFEMALVSYLEEEYLEIVKISEDGHKLGATWQDWKKKADSRARDLQKMGISTASVTIHPAEFLEYCNKNKEPLIGPTRAKLAAEKLAKRKKK